MTGNTHFLIYRFPAFPDLNRKRQLCPKEFVIFLSSTHMGCLMFRELFLLYGRENKRDCVRGFLPSGVISVYLAASSGTIGFS
jgi:hypothetical protein